MCMYIRSRCLWRGPRSSRPGDFNSFLSEYLNNLVQAILIQAILIQAILIQAIF